MEQLMAMLQQLLGGQGMGSAPGGNQTNPLGSLMSGGGMRPPAMQMRPMQGMQTPQIGGMNIPMPIPAQPSPLALFAPPPRAVAQTVSPPPMPKQPMRQNPQQPQLYRNGAASPR